MKHIKNIGLSLGISLSLILLSTLLTTVFSYFNILSENGVKNTITITAIVSLLVGSFFLGKHSQKKGWLEGAKLGIIFVLIALICNLLFIHTALAFKMFFYYFILLITTIFGSMIGINFKKEKE